MRDTRNRVATKLLALPKVWAIELTSSQQEFLKWLAIVSMTFDHVGKLVFGSALPAFEQFGRLAFPLFCFLIAYNVVRRGVNPRRYLLPLLLFGSLSQPVYAWAFDKSNLNIFFTLLLGAFYLWTVRQVTARRFHPLSAHMVAVSLVLLPSLTVSYDVSGAFLVPVLAVFLRFPHPLLLPLVAFYLMVTNDLYPVSVYTLLLLPAVYLSTHLPLTLPRSSKWLFYGFYPVHLLVLGLIGRYLA